MIDIIHANLIIIIIVFYHSKKKRKYHPLNELKMDAKGEKITFYHSNWINLGEWVRYGEKPTKHDKGNDIWFEMISSSSSLMMIMAIKIN